MAKSPNNQTRHTYICCIHKLQEVRAETLLGVTASFHTCYPFLSTKWVTWCILGSRARPKRAPHLFECTSHFKAMPHVHIGHTHAPVWFGSKWKWCSGAMSLWLWPEEAFLLLLLLLLEDSFIEGLISGRSNAPDHHSVQLPPATLQQQ
jgi:hypothetical protein